MVPRDRDVRNLALYAPKIALGMVLGVPRVPFLDDIPIVFSSSTVNAPPVVQSFQNNLSQDTLIERVTYNLFQQNSFPGNPLQSLYFSMLKQSGGTGVGVKVALYGSPKYDLANSDTFIDLGNVFDVLAATWPEGWLIPRQSNVKISAILLQTPVSVPFNIEVTFTGFSFLEKSLDDMSDADARAALRKLGIETPDPNALIATH